MFFGLQKCRYVAKFAQMQGRTQLPNAQITKIIFGLIAAAVGLALFHALLGQWYLNQFRLVSGDPIHLFMLCAATFTVISAFGALGFAAPLMFAAEKLKEKIEPRILQIFWVLMPEVLAQTDQARPTSSFRPPRQFS
jgi:hypothetical protein